MLGPEDGTMGLNSFLRRVQDARRNAGWRIRWIAWQEPGKPEIYKGNRTSMVFFVTGLLLFIGSVPVGTNCMHRFRWYGDATMPVIIGCMVLGLAVVRGNPTHSLGTPEGLGAGGSSMH